MKVGFTGTQKGMTKHQIGTLMEYLAGCGGTLQEFHHGDCIGADCEAHNVALMTVSASQIVIHPPDIATKRAGCFGRLRIPKPYLVRNRDIVRDTDVLVAAPGTASEQIRSGTWYTVRYARKIGRKIIVLLPNGGIA